MPIKTTMAHKECPIGKWGRFVEETSEKDK